MAVRLPGPGDIDRQRVENNAGFSAVPVDPTGAALANLGAVGQDIAQRLHEQQSENQVLRADMRARGELEAVRREIEDGDGEPEQYEADYTQRANEIVSRHANSIRTRGYRERWRAHIDDAVRAGGSRVRDTGQQRIVARGRADLLALGEEAEKLVGDIETPTALRDDAARNYEAAVGRAVERRVLDADDGERVRIGFRDRTLALRREGLRGRAYQEMEADPGSFLASLREDDGPYSELDPDARGQFIARAEGEVRMRAERAAAQWRSSVRERRQGAGLAWAAGLQAEDAPSVEDVRNAEGPDAARAYAIDHATFSAESPLQGLSMRELDARRRAAPDRGASQEEQLNALAGAAAADNVWQRLAFDPTGDAIARGEIADDGAVRAAIQQGDMPSLVGLLRTRSAQAAERAARLGTRQDPMTRQEAQELRGYFDAIPDDRVRQQQIATLFGAADGPSFGRGATFGDRDARVALARQVYPDLPGAVTGALLTGRAETLRDNREGRRIALDADTVAQRMIFGASLLSRPDVETMDNAGREGAQRARTRSGEAFQMPSEAALRRVFDDYVGDAYSKSEAEYAADFESYRAYVAGAARERGLTASDATKQGGGLDRDWRLIAEEGARAASGGVGQWNARSVVLPWGMSQSGFDQSVRAGWAAARERYPTLSGDISEYDLERAPGSNAYYLRRGDDAVINPETGRAIRLRVGR